MVSIMSLVIPAFLLFRLLLVLQIRIIHPRSILFIPLVLFLRMHH